MDPHFGQTTASFGASPRPHFGQSKKRVVGFWTGGAGGVEEDSTPGGRSRFLGRSQYADLQWGHRRPTRSILGHHLCPHFMHTREVITASSMTYDRYLHVY